MSQGPSSLHDMSPLSSLTSSGGSHIAQDGQVSLNGEAVQGQDANGQQTALVEVDVGGIGDLASSLGIDGNNPPLGAESQTPVTPEHRVAVEAWRATVEYDPEQLIRELRQQIEVMERESQYARTPQQEGPLAEYDAVSHAYLQAIAHNFELLEYQERLVQRNHQLVDGLSQIRNLVALAAQLAITLTTLNSNGEAALPMHHLAEIAEPEEVHIQLDLERLFHNTSHEIIEGAQPEAVAEYDAPGSSVAI